MSLKAGAKRSAARLPFLVGFERQKQPVGKWETCFRFSTFPRGAGAVGMWESQQRFPRAVGNEGKPGFGFPRFPPPVISIALRFLKRSAWAANGRIVCVWRPASRPPPECRISHWQFERVDPRLNPHEGTRPSRATASGSARAWHTSHTLAFVCPVPWPRLGLLRQQFVEQLGHRVI